MLKQTITNYHNYYKLLQTVITNYYKLYYKFYYKIKYILQIIYYKLLQTIATITNC